jgi:hypothetical protein
MPADLEAARNAAEKFRAAHISGKLYDRYPLDTVFLADNVLRMDLIPFPGLTDLIGSPAAIKPNLREMYVDDDLHAAYSDGNAKAWEVDRLRFSVAHEIAHAEMHGHLVSKIRCEDLHGLRAMVNRKDALRYEIEQEANEFAGRLIVPLEALKGCLDGFASLQSPRWRDNKELREAFCRMFGKEFGLNPLPGMSLRLDREGLWPEESATSGAKPTLTPKLRFPAFRNGPGWETKTLGSLATISTEKVGDNECVPMSITSGVGLVSQMEKFGRVIAGSSYKNYLLLKKNDFAYNKSATKHYPEGFIVWTCDSGTLVVDMLLTGASSPSIASPTATTSPSTISTTSPTASCRNASSAG